MISVRERSGSVYACTLAKKCKELAHVEPNKNLKSNSESLAAAPKMEQSLSYYLSVLPHQQFDLSPRRCPKFL